MYIAPNSTVVLFNNIPLANNYKDTLYFPSKTEQTTFFSNRQHKWLIENNSYITPSEGKMKVQLTADNLYDCTYMMFQNTNFGGKWFYAFINDVKYINNVTSEITFEIDVIQSFFYDATLKRCFVEREHSSTDVPGDNLEAEPVSTGQMVTHKVNTAGTTFDKYSAVLCKAATKEGTTAGGVVCGLFTGCDYTFAEVNNTQQVENLKEVLKLIVETNQQDSVVSLTLFPTFYCTKDAQAKTAEINITPPSGHGMFNGSSSYVPKNKKLLTYPYTYLVVDCGNNTAVYKYELFFDRSDIKFYLNGILTNNPQIMCTPWAYDGVGNTTVNFTERLVMEGFPQVGFSVDSFRAWLAQEASSVAISGIASGISMVAGAATGNPIGVVGGSLGIAGAAAQTIQAYNRPDQLKGVNTGSCDVATRKKNFYFKCMTMTRDHARAIDDFFTMYGYACNKVKVPNISARPNWNYVKTNGCVVSGGIPASAISQIESIFDSGITFWKSASGIGNYNADNSL